MERNDTLRIRLVNQLPAVPDAKHCPENPDLAGNPTNLHTHGLIVEPHRSTGGTDPYGDYVFVEIRNPTNPTACTPPKPAGAGAQAAPPGATHGHAGGPGGVHPDMDVAEGAVEYAINLVKHPPGLFWFHPHMHGLALNQVTSGLAGVITVGHPADECGGDAGCRAAISAGTERLLVLKDSEVLADGTLKTSRTPPFVRRPLPPAKRRGGVSAPEPQGPSSRAATGSTPSTVRFTRRSRSAGTATCGGS